MVACKKIPGAKWIGKCECVTAGYIMNEEKSQCVKSDELIKTEEQAESRIKIGGLYKKLDGMSNDFKVSVWKNADGNFNTARLTSDSIAAVVLGTTGALVTSNVVKKNQVSSGFEDINCQIGGQTVAGWKDLTSDFWTTTSINIGSKEGTNRSNATIKYVTVVDLENEPEPIAPTVYKNTLKVVRNNETQRASTRLQSPHSLIWTAFLVR